MTSDSWVLAPVTVMEGCVGEVWDWGRGSRILHLQPRTAQWSKEDKGTLADVSRES